MLATVYDNLYSCMAQLFQLETMVIAMRNASSEQFPDFETSYAKHYAAERSSPNATARFAALSKVRQISEQLK